MLEFQMRFSGALVDAVSFMTKLESQKNIFKVTNFNLDVIAQDEVKLGRVTGRLSIAVYRTLPKSEFNKEQG